MFKKTTAWKVDKVINPLRGNLKGKARIRQSRCAIITVAVWSWKVNIQARCEGVRVASVSGACERSASAESPQPPPTRADDTRHASPPSALCAPVLDCIKHSQFN